MKNVKTEQLKNCICLTLMEFKEVMCYIFGEDAITTVEYGVLNVEIFNEADDYDLEESQILEKLSDYFEVTALGIHINGYKEDDFFEFTQSDNSGQAKVWIIYQ